MLHVVIIIIIIGPHHRSVSVQPIVRPKDGVAWSVCLSVCLSRTCIVQKWLKQSRCHVGCGLQWAQGSTCV